MHIYYVAIQQPELKQKQKLLHMRGTVIPIIGAALGTVPKASKKD